MQPAHAQPTCKGIDLLPGLARSDPAAHARVLAAAKAEPNGEALLWKVETSGAAKPSWLFGTIHLTDDRVNKLTPAVSSALDGAATLALEVADISPQIMMQVMMSKGTSLVMTDGRTLGQMLSPKELEIVRAKASGTGLPADVTQLLRPWFATMLLARPDCEVARQEAGLKALDMALRAKAVARGQTVAGLETVGDQLDAMASLPPDVELAWLRSSLGLHDRIDDVTETVIRLYLERRMGAVWEVSQALSGPAAIPPDALDSIKRTMLFERNRRMADAARPLLTSGGVFIAVGALHLPGQLGLVQLLRDAGYTVTPVE